MNFTAVLAGVLVIACVAGCEPPPPVLSVPPTTYIAVDGTTHGIFISGQRRAVAPALYYGGVGVVGNKYLLVGGALDPLISNTACVYDVNTGSVAALDLPALTRLDRAVGSSSQGFVLVGLDVIGVLSPETMQLTTVSAPGAEAPAYGMGDGTWMIYPSEHWTRLMAINVMTHAVEQIPMKGTYVSPIGRDGDTVFVASDRTVYALRRNSTNDGWAIEKRRTLVAPAQTLVVVDGVPWALSSTDYPSRTYWEALDGRGLYIAMHVSRQAAILPATPPSRSEGKNGGTVGGE